MPGLVDFMLQVALIEEAKRGVRFPRLVLSKYSLSI